jgi:hypothetical protein
VDLGLWEQTLPRPQCLLRTPGAWRPAIHPALGIAAYGDAGTAVAGWLADSLRWQIPTVAATLSAGPGAGIHIGLVDALRAADVIGSDWRAARPFAGACAAQGYILEVRPDRAVLAALDAPGLHHAAATLLQALTHAGCTPLPCVRIEDWPDVPLRAAADWLLNAEINRWGLERGDGLAALRQRLERKLDLAARLKTNVVWFDGFGWDPDRTPDYASLVRELARYARQRHIRLAHAGYGGGYGFAYQKSFIYRSPYHGRLLENRGSYPEGLVYDCVGHPHYPASWRFGTCLSNQALADLKIAELTRFVRECHPGLLYIHDIDTGTLGLAREGWQRRCPQCRERWPADEMTAADGAAGAYAQWYRRVSAAINQVRADEEGYCAARDCEIVFVGPVYTDADDTEETWQAECEYFRLVSRLVGPCPNLQFGIREQVLHDAPEADRVARLRDHLDQAGNGHGVFVVAFTGGDNYYSDTLVPPGAALQGNYRGARTLYVKNLGSVFEPAQVLCAQYAWAAAAAGSVAAPAGREAGLRLLQQSRGGQLMPPGWLGPEGLLYRACFWLYGQPAAESVTRIGLLGLGDGVAPVATGWGSVSREVGALLSDPPSDLSKPVAHWQHRAKRTRQAAALAAAAADCDLRNPADQEDLRWLGSRFEISSHFCDLLAHCWQWRASPGEVTRATALQVLNATEDCLRQHVGRDTVDPVGGDVAVWYAIIEKVRALLL